MNQEQPMRQDLIDKYMWPALAWFGAVALVALTATWTANNFAWKIKCIDAGGDYLASSGGCRLSTD
ncbi:hypothetical protein [Leisingera sp. HS039]|uniref:hypothetical protein n=1 Tax=Leisingera sp. HS039 TaxID=2818496 RepID=UPI001B3A772F|nr:hypothetical protein [Leisingera sp. HS039]